GLVSTRVSNQEGVTTPIVTGTDFIYDTAGHLIEERKLGRVDQSGDEQTIQHTYASNDALWVRDLPLEEKHLAADGTIISDKQYLYGDDQSLLPFGQLGKGWLRQVRELYQYGTEPQRWVTSESMTYDALGNPLMTIKDGIARAIAY